MHSVVTAIIPAPGLQLEEIEQLITMPVKSKFSSVSKLLGTESETCLQRCLTILRPGFRKGCRV